MNLISSLFVLKFWFAVPFRLSPSRSVDSGLDDLHTPSKNRFVRFLGSLFELSKLLSWLDTPMDLMNGQALQIRLPDPLEKCLVASKNRWTKCVICLHLEDEFIPSIKSTSSIIKTCTTWVRREVRIQTRSSVIWDQLFSTKEFYALRKGKFSRTVLELFLWLPVFQIYFERQSPRWSRRSEIEFRIGSLSSPKIRSGWHQKKKTQRRCLDL